MSTTRTSAPRGLVALVALVAATSAAVAASPPTGAYGCYDATMAFSPVSGSHLQITPMPVVMFGLVDATTYADWDGHKGHYVYDAASAVLTMTDGSRQGWRYHKNGEWAFRLIDNRTGKEIYTCPLKAGGDPSHGPW